jgi:hypothetical protein
MSNSVVGHHTGLGQEDYQAISPYLRQPLRSLKEYLRDRKQRRNQQPQETAPDEADQQFKDQDIGPARSEGENEPG